MLHLAVINITKYIVINNTENNTNSYFSCKLPCILMHGES